MDDELSIDLHMEDPDWRNLVPDAETLVPHALLAAWRAVAAESGHRAGEVCLILGDDSSSQDLNARFRGIDKPTNVLSFEDGGDDPLPGHPPRLGDIYIARGVTEREAREQGKTAADHLVHLAVHGFLHLLGYDHQEDEEANLMEERETGILAELGIADPHGEPLLDNGAAANE